MKLISAPPELLSRKCLGFDAVEPYASASRYMVSFTSFCPPHSSSLYGFSTGRSENTVKNRSFFARCHCCHGEVFCAPLPSNGCVCRTIPF
jgi:hypothetical protein